MSNETFHHLAQFKVVDGDTLWVPLSSIASIRYNEDDDVWSVATTDGADFVVVDEGGQGIHSVVTDVVTWQLLPKRQESLVQQALEQLRKEREAEGFPGGAAS